MDTEKNARSFICLSFIIGLIILGCGSKDVVPPMEETFGEGDLYLWGGMSGGEKIYLNLDPHRRLYRLENAGDAGEISNEMKSRSPKISIQVKPMGENSFLLITRDDASVDFPDSEKIKFQAPVYTSKKTGFTYFFDGIIILRPKEGTTIEEILEREPETTLVKSLLGGTHFLAVENGDKVLNIANRIYESGLAGFSHPNYLLPVVLH